MLRYIGFLFKKFAKLIYRFSQSNSKQSTNNSIQSLRVEPWFRDKGDQTIRLNYDLCEDSLVFDLGGYEGQWSRDIFCKYACTIHIFEPNEIFAQNIQTRFDKNRKVHVHAIGLADSDKFAMLSASENESSMFKTSDKNFRIELKDAVSFIRKNDIHRIDLMKVNIEGGEYELLEYLIENGIIRVIVNIQVQFHDFVSDAEARMRAIQRNLEKTHYLTYQYEFVWENWKLKQE